MNEQTIAYSIGYYDGRVDGIEHNTFEGELRHYYTCGYDAGVADYCQETEEKS